MSSVPKAKKRSQRDLDFLLAEMQSRLLVLEGLVALSYGDAEEIRLAEGDLRGALRQRVQIEGQMMKTGGAKRQGELPWQDDDEA